MIVPLTLRLIAVPEQAWPRLTAACDGGEPLPTPMQHALAVAGASVLATVLGSLFTPALTFGRVAVQLVASSAGYLGAVALVVGLAPRLVSAPPRTQELVPRFASAAVLPIAASGILNLVPLTGLSFLWAVAGTGLSGWSAFIGASSLLGLEGPARRDAAVRVAAGGALPLLAATVFRLLVSP